LLSSVRQDPSLPGRPLSEGIVYLVN